MMTADETDGFTEQITPRDRESARRLIKQYDIDPDEELKLAEMIAKRIADGDIWQWIEDFLKLRRKPRIELVPIDREAAREKWLNWELASSNWRRKETSTHESYDIKYQLDCGRWVTVEECYISTSRLGVLAGSEETIRRHLIEDLPERMQRQFGRFHEDSFYIKPVPEGLPNFVFMVYLVSDLISESPHYHASMLIVCWLSDDITTSLPELIKHETRAIEWNKYAVDFGY